MSAIAVRAQCSKATLYGYFPSKDELFVQVVTQLIDHGMASIFASLDSESDIRQSLKRFGEGLLALRQSPDILGVYRIVLGEAGRSEIGRLLYETGVIRWSACMAEFLARKLNRPDTGVAARHLKALLEAELVEPLLLGARSQATASEIAEVTDRAVSAFLAAYPPRLAASVQPPSMEDHG